MSNPEKKQECKPKSKRVLLRFRLRTMLLLVAIISVLMGWQVNKVSRQKKAVEEIRTWTSAEIYYDYQVQHDLRGHMHFPPDPTLPSPKWLIDLVGIDFFSAVVYVSSDDSKVSDLELFRNLNRIRWLYLSHTPVTDLTPLAELKELEVLYLVETEVSDLSPLFGLKNLRMLWLSGSPISDGEINKLREKLPNCVILR